MNTPSPDNGLDPAYSPAARAALRNDHPAAGWEWRATTRAADYFNPFFDALPPTAKSVLDVGCGSGRLLVQLASRVERAVGLDLSETLLRLARDRQRAATQSNLVWVCASIHKPPLSPAGFDYIVSNSVLRLTHLPTALRQINRLLKPGGRLFVQDISAQAFFLKLGPLSQFYRVLSYLPSMLRLYGNRLGIQIAWASMGLTKRLAGQEPLWVGERAYAVYRELLDGCQIIVRAGDIHVRWDKPKSA